MDWIKGIYRKTPQSFIIGSGWPSETRISGGPWSSGRSCGLAQAWTAAETAQGRWSICFFAKSLCFCRPGNLAWWKWWKGNRRLQEPNWCLVFCPRKATQEKGNQCLLSLQKPYVFLSKNNTISTSVCFFFSRKKWSEKKSANSGDETVEKLIILDFPAFFAIFFKGIGSFYLSRDIFPFQTNNLWVCQCH